jgi:hypothetical protein
MYFIQLISLGKKGSMKYIIIFFGKYFFAFTSARLILFKNGVYFIADIIPALPAIDKASFLCAFSDLVISAPFDTPAPIAHHIFRRTDFFSPSDSFPHDSNLFKPLKAPAHGSKIPRADAAIITTEAQLNSLFFQNILF